MNFKTYYNFPFSGFTRNIIIKFFIAHDICIINILQKISRLQESPGHHDSLVDIAAYIGIYKTVYDAEIDSDFKKGDDL